MKKNNLPRNGHIYVDMSSTSSRRIVVIESIIRDNERIVYFKWCGNGYYRGPDAISLFYFNKRFRRVHE
jgi:hypothetical protein